MEEGRKEAPVGGGGDREGEASRTEASPDSQLSSVSSSPALGRNQDPLPQTWLPSQLNAEEPHTPNSPLASALHFLGPNPQTSPGPCLACLSALASDYPNQWLLRTHLHIHSSMGPDAPLALPTTCNATLPHQHNSPCPTLLALTSFDQSWKQLGLLFSLGHRSDGS